VTALPFSDAVGSGDSLKVSFELHNASGTMGDPGKVSWTLPPGWTSSQKEWVHDAVPKGGNLKHVVTFTPPAGMNVGTAVIGYKDSRFDWEKEIVLTTYPQGAGISDCTSTEGWTATDGAAVCLDRGMLKITPKTVLRRHDAASGTRIENNGRVSFALKQVDFSRKPVLKINLPDQDSHGTKIGVTDETGQYKQCALIGIPGHVSIDLAAVTKWTGTKDLTLSHGSRDRSRQIREAPERQTVLPMTNPFHPRSILQAAIAGLLTLGTWTCLSADSPAAAPAQVAQPPSAGLPVADWERKRILAAADAALAGPVFSITQHRAPLSEGGPNDFFSMSDYYWPDRRSRTASPSCSGTGSRIPGSSTSTAGRSWAARCRGRAGDGPPGDGRGAVRGEGRGAAARVLRRSRHPHEPEPGVRAGHRGQAGAGPRNRDHRHAPPRRGAVAIRALEGSPAFTPGADDRIARLVPRLSVWLRDSERGKERGEEHQQPRRRLLAAVAAFCQVAPDEALLAECRRQFKEVFVAVQMAPDGSFPLELKRTKPYAYSIFQLDNLASLCQLLATPEDNLWTFELPDGRGMRKAMAYLYPYLADKSPGRWPPDVMAWDAWPVRPVLLSSAARRWARRSTSTCGRSLKPDPADFEIRRNNAVTQPVLWMNHTRPVDTTLPSGATR
jgi:hypothetical protein